MIDLNICIWGAIGLFVYNYIFYVVDWIIKLMTVSYTPNIVISKFRTDYKINVRTFNRNTGSLAFAWIKTIWINEKLFRDEYWLKFALHHEYYHVKHNHKAMALLLRFIFSLSPILGAFIPWYLWIMIFLSFAKVIIYVTNDIYEKKANDYAKNKMKEDEKTSKRARAINNKEIQKNITFR